MENNKDNEPLQPFVMDDTNAPAYWNVDILWQVKATGKQTNHALSMIEQVMPYSSGPPPHVHPDMEEMFYVMEGEMTICIAGTVYIFKPGTFGFVPRNTIHYFKVTSQENCRVLNFYTPSGFEESVMTTMKAESLTLPPKGLKPSGTGDQVWLNVEPIDLINYKLEKK